MAHISASILRLDLAGGELDWMLSHGVFHAMVRGCVWFDSAVVLPTARQDHGISLDLYTIHVSYSGEVASLGQYLP